jgi:hypothetical protein
MRANDREGDRKSYSGDPEVDAVTARVRMAIEESNSRNSRPRSKSSDTSRMNPIYKPKASPGPATLNLYGAAKPRLGGNANARENRTSTKPAKSTTKNKVYNPNRDSAAAKVIRKIGRNIFPGF